MKKFLALLIVISFISCEESEDWYGEGETMFLKTEGAVLPIWVTGNTASGIFIIANHGGPGTTSAYDFYTTTSFKRLQEDYAIVYYDQRMSHSKGDPLLGDHYDHATRYRP